MTTSRVLVSAGLGAWRDAWDQLVLDAPLPSPFLRSWWLEAVVRRPMLLLVVADDELLGGLALEVAGRFPVRRLRVAGGGTLTPDHLDLVARIGAEQQVIAALTAWWKEQRQTLADLRGVRDGALVGDVFGPATVSPEDVAPSEEVASYDGWLADRSGSFRKRLRRLERQAERRGVVFREVVDAEVPAALDAFARWHATRDDRAEITREAPRLRAAVEAGHRAGEVVLVVAESSRGWGWVGFGFTTGDRLSLYQSARSGAPEFDGLGTLVDRALIERGCARGVHEIDFLRGTEPYKASFVGAQRPLLRVRAARGPLARVLRAAEETVRALRARVRGSRARPDAIAAKRASAATG